MNSPVALETLVNLTSKEKGGGLAYDPRIAVRAIHALGGRSESEAQRAIVDVLGRGSKRVFEKTCAV